MTMKEFSRAIGYGVGPGADGLVPEIPQEVIGHVFHRGVSLLRVLFERLGHYGVEIATQGAAELLRRSGTPRGVCDVSGVVWGSCHDIRSTRRFVVQDGFYKSGGGTRTGA